MPNSILAASSNEDINIIPILCRGWQSSRMGTRKELVQFPDGRPVFKNAIITIHDSIPTAFTIYISLHDKSQLREIQFRLDVANRSAYLTQFPAETSDEYGRSSKPPALEIILDRPDLGNIGPTAGLLAAHVAHPKAIFLVLGCDYPLLPLAALQQLILEYELPLTCFVNTEEITELMIAIWSPEDLGAPAEEVMKGYSGLNRVVGLLRERKVKPLRETWIKGCNAREEWEEILSGLQESNLEMGSLYHVKYDKAEKGSMMTTDLPNESLPAFVRISSP